MGIKITDTQRLDFLDRRISVRNCFYKADNKTYSYRYLQLHLGDRTIRQAIDAAILAGKSSSKPRADRRGK